MTRAPAPLPFHRLRRDEAGATLVEFGIVLSLFLLIFFGLVDFGRLAYHDVIAERGLHAAARVAAVRPPACAAVPEYLSRDPAAPDSVQYGTSCNAGGAICQDPGTISCDGNAANPTAAEIWALVGPTLPPGASISNLRFSYAYDPNLGFLGGPYVPVVTLRLQDVGFQFVTPLAGLAVLSGATPGSALDGSMTLPSHSVSLPAEDMAQGENG
jgi:hypothetical protein